ncbi:Acetyl esterase/lipase [Pseudoxanthomonas indica]|uniref:Acetyl esterase/lipase n=1 Tax=Pseudoxanthomonas indica TaxID=428993 RepID=A0A1T5K5U6_9GAMM|nr:Acetyl esterase/lipase [Pseudoxanthomonas indica]
MSRCPSLRARLLLCLATAATSAGVHAQPAQAPADTATTAMPATDLPYSGFASDAAKAKFAELLAEVRAGKAPNPTDIADQRQFYQRYNDARLQEVQRRYPAKVSELTLAGVSVHSVEPAGGIAAAQRQRVLINLHGGAFMWGAGSGALVEAIPIATVAGMRVVTVDYRLAPEHTYPAAVDDVEAVYRELLKHYRAENIGIYGCSAGGVLTAQATARLLQRKLPAPGAIGMFCGTGLLFRGDSGTLGQLAVGQAPMGSDGGASLPYLSTAKADDVVAYPMQSPELLARFPPSLLLAGGRDFALSALTTAQRRLLAAGVDARLIVFDGLWHAFFVFPDLPESQEAYARIGEFFDQQLGRAQR